MKMKFESKICEISREESMRAGKELVFTKAKIRLDSPGSNSGLMALSDVWLGGFEPEVAFVLGQKVVIVVGEEP
jgi:hypothetical protein